MSLGSKVTEELAAAEGLSSNGASMFGGGETGRSIGLTTRLNRTQIKEYLANVIETPRGQLVKDIESLGFEFKGSAEDGKFMSFSDKYGNVRIKIHPPDRVTKYEHMHVYNKNAQDLSADLSTVHYRSPEAHIEIAPDDFDFSQEYYNGQMSNRR